MVQPGIVLQPPRKSCLFPLSPGFPQNGPFGSSCASEQLGRRNAFGPFSSDSGLASAETGREGSLQAQQVPLKRNLVGEEGAWGGSLEQASPQGRAPTGACQACCLPLTHLSTSKVKAPAVGCRGSTV